MPHLENNNETGQLQHTNGTCHKRLGVTKFTQKKKRKMKNFHITRDSNLEQKLVGINTCSRNCK